MNSKPSIIRSLGIGVATLCLVVSFFAFAQCWIIESFIICIVGCCIGYICADK